MGGHIGPLVRRAVFAVLAGAIVLGALDGGSVALTRLQLPEDIKQAGYAATEVSGRNQTNRQTAVAAWKAADKDAGEHGVAIESKDFTIYPDGRVTLTGTKTAPTLLLHRVAALEHLTRVTSTETVKALPYASAPQLPRRNR